MSFKERNGFISNDILRKVSVKFQKKGHEENRIILCVIFAKMLLI